MSVRRSARYRRALIGGALAALAGLVAGCGFELRGSTSLPQDVQSVHVIAPADLAAEISILLEGNGVRIATDTASADAVIRVSSATFDRRVLSVNPSTGKEREFEVSYSVSFDVTRRSGGGSLVPNQSFRLLRDYVFDSDAIIGKSREEGVLHEEMVRDAAQQLLRRTEAALTR